MNYFFLGSGGGALFGGFFPRHGAIYGLDFRPFVGLWNALAVAQLTEQQLRNLRNRKVDSLAGLDLASLLRVFNFNFDDISQRADLSRDLSTWLREMQGIRNRYAHATEDLSSVDNQWRDLDMGSTGRHTGPKPKVIFFPGPGKPSPALGEGIPKPPARQLNELGGEPTSLSSRPPADTYPGLPPTKPREFIKKT